MLIEWEGLKHRTMGAMRLSLGIFWAFGVGLAWSQGEVAISRLGKDESLSRSGQILVRSPDGKIRVVMASFANTVSDELGRILGDGRTPWVHSIEIETRGSLADSGVRGRTMATQIDLLDGDRLVLHLLVKLSDEFSRQQFSREILRLLILERMLRRHKGEEDLVGKKLEVPHWVLSGVNGLIDYRRLGRPSDLYAGIVRSRQLLSVDEILVGKSEKLDSLTRATYEASAAALLAALFDQPEGAKNFSALLARLIFYDGDSRLLLKEQFAGLRGGAHSVDKWWALQVASMGELQAMEYFGIRETETLLDQALWVDFSQGAKEGGGGAKQEGFWKKMLPFRKKTGEFTFGRIHDFEKFYKRKDCEQVLEQNLLKLNALQYRCFPLYGSVIAKYENVVKRLMKGKRKRVAEDLLEIDAERESVGMTMQRTTDFLNYYEATQLENPGVDFEKYHQTRARLRKAKPPVRTDRISKYLDEMEREYSGGVIR